MLDGMKNEEKGPVKASNVQNASETLLALVRGAKRKETEGKSK